MNDKTENLQQDDFNDEAWLDENLRPLVSQMYQLCEERGIPFVAVFAYGLDTSSDDESRRQVYQMGGACNLPANDRVPCEMRVAQTLLFEGFKPAAPQFLGHLAAEACGAREASTEHPDRVPAGASIN